MSPSPCLFPPSPCPLPALPCLRQHNPMDMRLHAEAERLLTERRQHWSQQGLLEELPKINPAPIPDLPIQLALKIPLPKEGAHGYDGTQ